MSKDYLNGMDLAGTLSKLTNRSYENSYMDISRSPVLDGLGNYNVKAFHNLAVKSPLVSSSDVCREISKATGCGYENVLMKINKIDY